MAIELRKSFDEFDVEHDDCIFKCKQLSEVELEQANYLIAPALKDGLIMFTPKAIKFILEKCLVGWENVKLNGKDYNYKDGEEAFLPSRVRSHLANTIYAQSSLTDTEKKT